MIKGKIFLKGSMPHSYLGIKDILSNKEYKIVNKSDFNLQKLQNHTVKIEAKLIKDALGPGFPATIQVLRVEE